MPLTAEEKKQRKAEKKAQKLRDAEARKIKARKDELDREVKTSQANIAAYMKEWYNRNYAVRYPKIKDEMELAWSNFEHVIDVKDFIIAELMEKIHEAKIQEAMGWQDYSTKIDQMISKFQINIENLKSDYQTHLKEIMKKAQEAREKQQADQERLEDYYKTILYMMEEQFNESMTVAQGEYMTKRDEQDKKGVHDLGVMAGALERNLNTVVEGTLEIIQEHLKSTEMRRKDLDVLMKRDEYYDNMIKRQDVKMAKLVEEMSVLQNQVNEKHESKMALEELRNDREETYGEYMEDRAALERDSTLDGKQLMTLTHESYKVIKSLERILEKGEKILRLGSLCRRLETQDEKVSPFGIQFDIKEDLKELENSPFALFWRRLAHVDLIKQKLTPTLYTLEMENMELEENLKTVLDIMAMTGLGPR